MCGLDFHRRLDYALFLINNEDRSKANLYDFDVYAIISSIQLLISCSDACRLAVTAYGY